MVSKSNKSLVITKDEIRNIIREEIKKEFSNFRLDLAEVLKAAGNIWQENKDK